ncbi:transglutaminase domain-containing protein [Thalassobellus citreus]|uniref:transglutaminase domain-containing protein n=1 Tax=Thalassobellus citreus TaxID=3367752 RepID=UPI00379CA067
MKQFYFTLLLLLSFLFTYSQENDKDQTYRVSLSDLKMTSYAKDSTANALVLYEKGNSYVDEREYDLRTQEKHKIKILNKEGFNHANVTIYLYKSDNNKYEEVEDIMASTYNLIDGEVVITKLDKKNIYREKYDENHTLVKFTLPNIKEGCVITYSYNLISPFMFKYKGWNFQGSIPKLYSEYCTSIPGNWEYNIKLVGGKKLFINESKVKKDCLRGGNGGVANCFEAKYAMKDMPAFIEEDYMTSKSNYLARIEYELKVFTHFDGRKNLYTKTWKTVDADLKKEKTIGKQLSKSIKAEEILPPNIFNETDPLKKAKAIYQFTQKNYSWNNEFRMFNDVSIKDLIKTKSGNATAINILLKILLEETGIHVNPVLISTRANGFATKIYPVISDFNYLIVQATIEGKTYLLDATDDYLSFGDIPFRCLNQDGRLLDFKNGSKWIDIKPQKKSTTLYNVELHIDTDNNFAGIVKNKRTGYHALKVKKKYFPNEDAYIERLANNSPYIEIFDYDTTTNDKTSPDFSESYNIEYNTDNTGDILYINPFFTKFFTENPFKLQERTYPIDFGYKDIYLYMFKLNFDENYSVIDKPEDLILSLPNNEGLITFSTKVLGNSINLVMKIDFKEAIYPPEYYPYLKKFMSKIVDIQTNSIIALKKN